MSKVLQDKDIIGTTVNVYELGDIFLAILSRALAPDSLYGPRQLWQWFKTLREERIYYRPTVKKDILEWLTEHRASAFQMFDVGYNELPGDGEKWSFTFEFPAVMMGAITDRDLAEHILETSRDKKKKDEADPFLYESLGILIFRARVYDLFDTFYWLGEDNAEFTTIRDAVCQSRFPGVQQELNLTRSKHERERLEGREKNRTILSQTKEQIRSGNHLSHLGFLARVYFGNFYEIDTKAVPVERLRTEVGDELTAVAIEGFSEIIKRSDLPSAKDVASSGRERTCPTWWFAILAGMDEEWRRATSIAGFSEMALKAGIAIAIEFPTVGAADVVRWTDRGWSQRLLSERPDIAWSVFEDMARSKLTAGDSDIDIIFELSSKEQAKPWRSKLALTLLKNFPVCGVRDLYHMIGSVIEDPECYPELIEIAKAISSDGASKREQQKAVWLVLGFSLDYETFRQGFHDFSYSHSWFVWTYVEAWASWKGVRHGDSGIQPSVDQSLSTLIQIFGKQFRNVHHPQCSSEGNRNPWDAAQFVRSTIDVLSGMPEPAASEDFEGFVRQSRTGLISRLFAARHRFTSSVAPRTRIRSAFLA